MMNRRSSSSSLCLLDRDQDLDSCYSESDVFDPPAWRPGRFLQFADIITVEDEPSVRPVSLPTDRLGPHGLYTAVPASDEEGFVSVDLSPTSVSSSSVTQMDTGRLTTCHWRLASRRTTMVVTSCLAVALTALTLLSLVLY